MIIAEPQNMLSDYTVLGFDKNLQKLPDELYDGAMKTGDVITSLVADRQVESVSINKLTTNQFKQTMTLGRIVLNGKDGSIQVMDKNNRVVAVIGKL